MDKGSRWDRHFLREAVLWSRMSKDPSTQVGAILVGQDRRIVSTGYNGFPPQIKDSLHLLEDRDKKYPRIIHAEMNAILNAVRSTHGATAYVTLPPCGDHCAKLLLGAGIVRVHALQPTDPRHEESSHLGRAILLEGGVESVWWTPEEIEE